MKWARPGACQQTSLALHHNRRMLGYPIMATFILDELASWESLAREPRWALCHAL
jgi:hypothetical protein